MSMLMHRRFVCGASCASHPSNPFPVEYVPFLSSFVPGVPFPSSFVPGVPFLNLPSYSGVDREYRIPRCSNHNPSDASFIYLLGHRRIAVHPILTGLISLRWFTRSIRWQCSRSSALYHSRRKSRNIPNVNNPYEGLSKLLLN